MRLPLGRRLCCGRRWSLRSSLFLALFLLALAAILLVEPGQVSYAQRALSDAVYQEGGSTGTTDIQPTIDTPLHILVPATKQDINLCKLLLGMAVLEYPTPTLLAFNETFTADEPAAATLHTVKMERVRSYLDSLGPEHDNDLVLLTDAYDIWFQLSPQVLVSRYRRIIRNANARLRKKLGSAMDFKDVKQSIVFAAGKTCSPNDPHSVACYPIPQPPTPEDTYNGNTDTPVGRTEWSSYRPRFLNSGYAIGPVKDMHRLFEQASRLVAEYAFSGTDRKSGNAAEATAERDTEQRILSLLFGRQEYQRETMRRAYMSLGRRLWLALHGDSLTSNNVQGIYVNDILNPSFPHETVDLSAGRNYEFGIVLDYDAELGHATANSDQDGTWLKYKQDFDPQIKGRNGFDCTVNLRKELPPDILDSPPPFTVIPKESHELLERTWGEVPLFTNLCYGTVPVMIHNNNGDEAALEGPWHNMWYQQGARENLRAQAQKAVVAASKETVSLADHKKRPSTLLLQGHAGGAWSETGGFLEWKELCPNEWNKRIFGPK